MGFQGPQFAAQTIFVQDDAPIGIGAVMFAQNFGPALFVPVAKTIFSGRLEVELKKDVPGFNETSLDKAGVLNLNDFVGPGQVECALNRFDAALSMMFCFPLFWLVLVLLGH